MSTAVTRLTDSYQITLDGEPVGNAFFVEHGHTIVFTHTEIDPAHEGKGLGGTLARAALDDVRARGEHVIARCPFIAAWIERHPDYQDLLTAHH